MRKTQSALDSKTYSIVKDRRPFRSGFTFRFTFGTDLFRAGRPRRAHRSTILTAIAEASAEKRPGALPSLEASFDAPSRGWWS